MVTTRALLIRGLLAGFVAGLIAFAVAFFVGEEPLERAIHRESSAEHHPSAHSHSTAPESASGASAHTHESTGTYISRGDQKTWGLSTGMLVLGTVLGGILSLAYAFSLGRFGTASGQTTALLLTGIGFLATTVIPFLKYPASPPGSTNPETLDERSALFFGFLALSIISAIVAVIIARRSYPKFSTFTAGVCGIAAYALIMIPAAALFTSIEESGDFPADLLWSFRIGSLLTLASLWVSFGILFTWLANRLTSSLPGE